MICKTFKKVLVGTTLTAVALGVVANVPPTRHYVRTALNSAFASFKRSVPIEYKIDEARQKIAALEPAIEEGIQDLARASVEVDDLRDQIQVARTNLDVQKTEMLTLKALREEGRVQLTDGRVYSAEKVEADLARRLDAYKRSRETLSTQEATLQAKLEYVASVRETLDEMIAQQQTLLAEVEAIESQLARLRADNSTSEFTYDDTPLSDAKETIDDLQREIEIMAREAELEGRYIERGVSVDVAPERDILSEIEAELGDGNDDSVEF